MERFRPHAIIEMSNSPAEAENLLMSSITDQWFYPNPIRLRYFPLILSIIVEAKRDIGHILRLNR